MYVFTNAISQDDKLEATRATIYRKIEIEQKCQEGAANMLKQLTDKNSVQQCKITITESRKRMDFLVSELQKLGVPGPPESEGSSLGDFRIKFPQRFSKELIKRNSEPGCHRHEIQDERPMASPSSHSRSVAQLSTSHKPAISSVFSSILSSFGLKPVHDTYPSSESSHSNQRITSKPHPILLGSHFSCSLLAKLTISF
jgi:hypothetical protein